MTPPYLKVFINDENYTQVCIYPLVYENYTQVCIYPLVYEYVVI